MSRRRKIGIVIACIIAGFLVACVVVAPRLFQVDRYRPYVTSLIERKTGRKVEIGRLGLAVLPVVTITADDVAIANPPGFPAGNWLSVARINARPDVGALWHHQIVIRSLRLSQPVLNLLSDARGHWNYESPVSPSAAASDPPQDPNPAPAAQPGPSFTLQEISDLSFTNGSVRVASVAPSGESGPPLLAAEGVSSELKNINLAAFANPRASAAGLANATGDLSVKVLNAANLRLTNVTSPVEATPQQVRFSNVRFDFYSGRGQAVVRLNLATPALQYSAQGQLSGVNAEELLDGFPQARSQLTGTLESHFSFSGQATNSPDPWAGKQGQGTLAVRKGRLPKLRLDEALLDLAHLAQMGPTSGDLSAFSLISLEWRLDQGLVRTRNVHIVGNGITVDGSGTLDLAGPGRLNYVGNAEIVARQNPLTNILADVSGATFANGRLALPFTLGGTLDRPLFRIKAGNVLGQALQSPVRNVKPTPQTLQNLFDLFKRKK